MNLHHEVMLAVAYAFFLPLVAAGFLSLSRRLQNEGRSRLPAPSEGTLHQAQTPPWPHAEAAEFYHRMAWLLLVLAWVVLIVAGVRHHTGPELALLGGSGLCLLLVAGRLGHSHEC